MRKQRVRDRGAHAGRSTLAMVVVALAAVLVTSGPLTAVDPVPHTALDKAVPAVDSSVDAPVSELHLVYTTPVQIRLSSVSVSGPAGAVDTGDLAFVADSGEHGLEVPLASPLGPGSYTVSWRTAGPDSHPIRGEYSFTVSAAR